MQVNHEPDQDLVPALNPQAQLFPVARSFLQRSDVERPGVHGLRMVGRWRFNVAAAAEEPARGATLQPAGGALGGTELSEPWDAQEPVGKESEDNVKTT